VRPERVARRLADGSFPNAPPTGRVAGIESKSLRDDARFCAVERFPRLSDACALPAALVAARGAARFFALVFAPVLARASGAFFVTFAVVFLGAVEAGFRPVGFGGVARLARVGGSSLAADGCAGVGASTSATD
jgi:hypothetical protein